MKNKNKKFDVVTIGGATRDIMFYSGEGELISTANMTKQKLLAFEYGAKILADKLYFTFGGGATNTALTFAKLGLTVGVFSRIGNDDTGKDALKNLKENKVDTSLIKIDRQNKTGFSMILTVKNSDKEHIAFLHRGANDLLSANDLNLNKINTNWFYLSSLPKKSWEDIMKKVVRKKTNIAWNPGSQQLKEIEKMKKFLPRVNIFIVNRDEALEFRKLKDIKGLIKYIYNLGPEIVVITDGSRGAYVFDGQKYYFMKIKSGIKAVDTIGVGDAFASAFTCARIYGKNIKQALKWGMNNSASAVSKIGAQNGLLNKHQIEKQ